ncbi:MAG TPA: class I SAM-dependent methyltransferase, partial [Planctomycetota bacterium]|nr:class I SAM-dependent methyltransferase [Planctomycetota bacterium]
ALADRFAEVIGVDCAESMLKGARQHNRHGDRVRYVHNECPDLQVFPDASFDLLMSLIVLQHMRQDYQAGYLREFVRVLRPGGVLYVQFATVPAKGYQPGVAPPERPDEAIIEIHGMPAPVARAALQGAGADILYEVADGWAGVEWESMHLAARRRR